MSVERDQRETGKESAAKKVADMDSLCEEISRAIVEGLVEKQILDEPQIAPPPESQIAETTVIAPIEDVAADRMITAVESLLESDEISQRIVRIVQEKIEQVLEADVVQSTRGDSGIIAERVHLECTRLFARESFRRDVVDLLRADVEGTVAPTLRHDLSAYVRGVLLEVTGLLVDRVTDVLRGAKEVKLPPAAVVNAVAPAASTSAASPVAAPEGAPAAATAAVSPTEGPEGVPAAPTSTAAPVACSVCVPAPVAAESPAQPAAPTPASAYASSPAVESEEEIVLIVAPSPDDRPEAPAGPPPSFRTRDARAVAEAYARIRERLWWEGKL